MARQQSWQDVDPPAGRLVVVSDNPVSRALVDLAALVHRQVVHLAEDEDGAAVSALRDLGLTADDAVVLCDHDAPDADQCLRDALGSPAGYVAMLGSRGRSATVLEQLRSERVDVTRLHMPAGLAIGGRRPGEMALSILAEVVATSYGKVGGPLRDEGQPDQR